MSKSERRNLIVCALLALWLVAAPGAAARGATSECLDSWDCGPTEYCCDSGTEWAVCCETGVAPGTSPEYCVFGRCEPWP